ncbi:MAG: T9SS type A sorting domain-containing protein [Bacteroidetes bacterium]|nr:T9SS type A sorting domain-containing protein [Bacteroidota bacterium]
MKRLTSIAVLLIIAAITVRGQQSVNINLTVPDTLGGCMPNRFTAKVKSQGAKFTITPQLMMGANVASCTDIGLYIITDSISGNVVNMGYDTITKKWSAEILDTDTVTIIYRVAISCSNIPQNSDSINNIKLKQIFSDENNIYTYTVNPLSSTNEIIRSLLLPLIIDRSPATWQTSYGEMVDIYYYYYNGGSANARIRFTFKDDSLHYCGVLQQQSLMYRNGNTNYVSYVSGDTTGIILKANDTLVFRSRNIVASCLTQCSNGRVQFSWSCDTALPATDYFCKSCKVSAVPTYYSLQSNNQPDVGYTRVMPATLPDMSCMNDSVHWRYVITNTGVGALDTLSITFKALLAYTFQNLSLIDTGTFEVRAINCTNCNLKVNKLINQNNLCSTVVPVSLQQAVIQTDDFGKTDTLVIDFTTYRCVQDTAVLLNTGKYYDRWEFESKAGVCGISKQVNHSITNNPLLPDADINQQLIFVPLVSDLSVPPGMNTIWGDSTTMEIEMKGMMGDDYDYTLLHCPGGATGCIADGWIRATVHCEQNLTVPTLATGLRLRWLNPATNQYVYKAPDFYHTPNDSGLCVASDYYYYFDLSDTLMRLMLDSGVCEFTLRACCNGDIARTPYSVTFHLLADPSGNCNSLSMTNGQVQCAGAGCAWLPLSVKGGSIAVHCPGCKRTGPISFRYVMERTSLGLEDTDNDGIADTSAQVIDQTSQWYQTYGNRLRLNMSSYGDQLRDRLVAHTQEGDPSNGGYDMNMLNQKGAYLKYMQVSRTIPSAFDTMKLTVTGFTLYIDKPNATQTSCINCSDFNVGGNYRTQHIINVSGNNLYHFLDTIISHNSFLFTFSAYDSAGAVYGNLFDYNYINSYYTDTIDTLKNFFEGQRYRLEVTYSECGSFEAPNSINLSVDDYLHQKLISNNLWLSGKKQSYDAFDMNLSAPNDITDVELHGWTFDINNNSLLQINQQFADSFIFICENFSGYHYVFSQEGYNTTSITSDTSCRRLVTLTALLQSAGGEADLYPYEYRLPAYSPQSYTINIPQGYHTVPGSGWMRYLSYTGLHGQTPEFRPWIPVSIPSGGGAIQIQDSNTGQAVCWNEDKYPAPQNDNSQYAGGYKMYKYIVFEIEPDNCPSDSVNIYADSVNIAFHASDYGCYPTTACDTVFSKNMQQNYLFPARPNLSALLNPGNVTATGHQVCMNLEFSNKQQSVINYADASNVYVIVPGAPYLTNWSYSVGNGAVQPVINGVVPVLNNLPFNSVVNVQLCADYDSCITDTVKTFMLQYGWNCEGYPAASTQVPDSVCYADSIEVNFKPEHEQLSYSFKEHDSTYTLCRNFEVSMTVNNAGLGAVYPLQVFVDSLVSSLQVQSVIISNCSTQASDTLMVSGTNTWSITGANMASIGFADSSLAAECMLVRVILNPTCAYRNVNILPNLVVIMQNLCNDTIVQTANRIHSFTGQSTSDTIVWNGQSNCTDCWSITKTADADTATAVTDTVTYTITVCNNSANAQTGVLSDMMQGGFVVTATTLAGSVTLNPMQCDTFTVSGYFTQYGSCFYNVATVTSPANTTWQDSVCVEVVSPCANIPNSITLADSSFSLPMNSNYSNTTFVVQGRFYINDNLTLINCHIYTYPAAQIIVLSGGTFSLYGTTVEACTQMWQGIQLRKNSTLIMSENSIVRDAENGITALHGSAYQLKDSRVIDCVRSIYVPQQSGMNNVQAAVDGCKFGLYASTFKPDYAGQPAHESLPRACIEVYDVVMTIEGKANRNEFYNSNWGIYAHRSYVVVSNCKFNNMRKGGPAYGNATHKGAALVAESTSPASAGKLTVLPLYNHDITIDTCQWGVYTEWTNATVTNVSMRNVNLSGVFNIRCNDAVMSTTISNCDIEAAKTGIQWQNSEKGIMKAVNNRIKVWSGGNAVGIKLISTGTNTGNYQITGNTIEATNGSGITASSAKNVNVINNTIKLSGNTNNGVSIAGCDSSQVSCNAVSGRYPVFGYQNKGISISHSTANFMNCNNVDSTYLGVYFEGVCTGTRIRGTEMKNHFEGLRLFSNAVIDTQAHAGNLWVGSFNNYGANNLNYVPSTNLLQSAFLIDYSYGGVYIPTVPVNNAGWIIPQTGNEFDCSGYLTCMDVTHETIAATALQLTIAEDSLETAEFTDESKIMARNYLYKDIKNNDSLVNSNYSLNAFLAANENMVTGKLYDVSNGINLANSISETEIHDLMAMDNFTDNIIQSITSLDSIAAADSTINLIDQREILMQQLNTVIQDKQNLMYMLNTATQQALSNVQVANSSIITNNAPDEYEQIMNDVEIEYEIGGMAALQNKCSQVFDIAVQCPHIGGKAVYKARSYVALMNDTIEYDDVTVCAQAGFRKSAETRNTKEEIKGNIKIVPNPTNEKITVTISDDMNGMCEIQFNDVVGKSVLLKELDCNQKTHTLNIKLLSEGIYTVKVNQSNHVSEQFKLIIVR